MVSVGSEAAAVAGMAMRAVKMMGLMVRVSVGSGSGRDKGGDKGRDEGRDGDRADTAWCRCYYRTRSRIMSARAGVSLPRLRSALQCAAKCAAPVITDAK